MVDTANEDRAYFQAGYNDIWGPNGTVARERAAARARNGWIDGIGSVGSTINFNGRGSLGQQVKWGLIGAALPIAGQAFGGLLSGGLAKLGRLVGISSPELEERERDTQLRGAEADAAKGRRTLLAKGAGGIDNTVFAGLLAGDKEREDIKAGRVGFNVDATNNPLLIRTGTAARGNAAPKTAGGASNVETSGTGEGQEETPIMRLIKMLAALLQRDDTDKSNDKTEQKVTVQLDKEYAKDSTEAKFIATLEKAAGTSAQVDGKLSAAELNGAVAGLRGAGVTESELKLNQEGNIITIASPTGGIESALARASSNHR